MEVDFGEEYRIVREEEVRSKKIKGFEEIEG